MRTPTGSWATQGLLGKIGFREGSIFVGEISIDLRDLPHELYLSGLPEGCLDRSTDERSSGLWRGQGGRKREDRV